MHIPISCGMESFSNAQTGNVVLMSQSFFTGDWGRGLRYLFPLLAFIAGVFVAEKVQGRFKYAKKIHWRQGILIGEILILLVVSFIPESLNTVATALVSFSCAMQVQAFRKVNGYSYASTMCIGNIRSGTAALSAYHRETETGAVEAGVILYRDYPVLCASAPESEGICPCGLESRRFGISVGLLLVSLLLMFIEKE